MSHREPFVPLAITGLGCLFPGKPGNRGFWNTVLQGIDQIRDIPADRWKPADHFDPDPARRDMVYAARGAFLSPVSFSPAEYGITPASLEATDTAQLLGLHVARLALLDAGYAALPRDPGKPLPKDRASVIVGVTMGKRIPEHIVKYVAAALFIASGVWLIAATLMGGEA